MLLTDSEYVTYLLKKARKMNVNYSYYFHININTFFLVIFKIYTSTFVAKKAPAGAFN